MSAERLNLKNKDGLKLALVLFGWKYAVCSLFGVAVFGVWISEFSEGGLPFRLLAGYRFRLFIRTSAMFGLSEDCRCLHITSQRLCEVAASLHLLRDSNIQFRTKLSAELLLPSRKTARCTPCKPLIPIYLHFFLFYINVSTSRTFVILIRFYNYPFSALAGTVSVDNPFIF